MGEEKKAIQGAPGKGHTPVTQEVQSCWGPPGDGAESFRRIPSERQEILSIYPVCGPTQNSYVKSPNPNGGYIWSNEVIKVKGHKGEALILQD